MVRHLARRLRPQETNSNQEAAEAAPWEQNERLGILLMIMEGILDGRQEREIIRPALTRIRMLLKCQLAGITDCASEGGRPRMIVRYMEGQHPQRAEGLVVPEYVVGSYSRLKTGASHRVEDLRRIPRCDPVLRCLREEGIRSCISVPLLFRGELLGCLNLASKAAGAWPESRVRSVRRLADSLAVALAMYRLMDAQRLQRDQMKSLTARLTTAEETERRRLARELHDRVGSNLTALTLNLHRIELLTGQRAEEDLRRLLEDCQLLLEETAHLVRDVMDDLRPAVLDDFGLLAALRWQAERFSRRAGIAIRVRGRDLAPPLPAETAAQLFRVVQEALTNVTRHARADRVLIDLRENERIIWLTVADNGTGFDYRKSIRSVDPSGLGLVTMRERVESIGGTLDVSSRMGRGTQIHVRLPRPAIGDRSG